MKARQNDADPRPLIEAAQQDPNRFADVYELYFERVYAYVARHTRSRDAAEDITSEVFHNALANLTRFEWRGVPFSAWLFRIAANALADYFNRLARTRANSNLEGFDPPDPSQFSTRGDVDADRARLFRLVRELPDVQRRVVEMRFAEEKSIREIALAIGRSEGAVKQLQFRALESLRAQVGGKGRRKSGEQNG
ncbi:MAG TPA: sigma-70 family RNA polymerase sigma factor [Candidatus Acidoferrales bacterium]|nr:sigma-70 family RNA polymerase sigma factor [Candidatus Acidoferrales bacterium]